MQKRHKRAHPRYLSALPVIERLLSRTPTTHFILHEARVGSASSRRPHVTSGANREAWMSFGVLESQSKLINRTYSSTRGTCLRTALKVPWAEIRPSSITKTVSACWMVESLWAMTMTVTDSRNFSIVADTLASVPASRALVAS